MNLQLLEILCCPECQNKLECFAQKTNDKGKVEEGELRCHRCHLSYPIIRSIPRFVPMDNYAASFGYQWNLYKYTQVDQYSNISHSEQRFFSETNWTKEDMKDNWILEGGCGNGRFLDVCSRSNCEVVGVDISSAVDAAGELFKDRDNVHLVQASLYKLPFKKHAFHKCYSIGVIQHTPNPKLSIKALTEIVKPNGQIALTIYERKPWTLLYSKYLLRPITKRMNKKLLLFIIKLLSPILFPVTELLYRIPVLNKFFKLMIPYANYVNMRELSLRQRYEWAILDTFDMLSPAYDLPMKAKTVRQCLENAAMKNIKRLPNPGVNMIAVR